MSVSDRPRPSEAVLRRAEPILACLLVARLNNAEPSEAEMDRLIDEAVNMAQHPLPPPPYTVDAQGVVVVTTKDGLNWTLDKAIIEGPDGMPRMVDMKDLSNPPAPLSRLSDRGVTPLLIITSNALKDRQWICHNGESGFGSSGYVLFIAPDLIDVARELWPHCEVVPSAIEGKP